MNTALAATKLAFLAQSAFERGAPVMVDGVAIDAAALRRIAVAALTMASITAHAAATGTEVDDAK